MSPLARLIRSKQDNGLSFREMERRALLRGHSYGSSAFEQLAKDERKRPLSRAAVEAVAAGLSETPQRIAELDNERHHPWGKAGSIEAAIDEDVTLSRKEKERLREVIAEMRARKPPSPNRADTA